MLTQGRTTLALALALTAAALAAAPAALAAPSPYTSAPIHETAAPHNFGQAPVFTPGGRVVWGDNAGKKAQIFSANIDGSDTKCLTCGQPGPNGVPNVRPQGDWILFHSWRGHSVDVGSPGFGGLGSDIYVMRPDGSHVTKLTGTDPAKGSGEGEDAYHGYWSPDGKHIVWAHLNWNFIDDGGSGKWDIRVADFVDDGVHPPHLANERVVRPANGHFYETQWWAPDGSGFLYTETYGYAMNTDLFFCKLTPTGCDVRRLTNDPAWDEQAIFTPDGRDVVFMSTRSHPGFYNEFTALTQAAGLTTDEDWLLSLPVFEAGFLQPAAPEATDLHLIDLDTGQTRRLTTDGDQGWITPEFTWDPTNRFLYWTQLKVPDGARVSLPIDLVSQLKQTAAYLRNPQNPAAGGQLTAVPLVARTRELSFDVPDVCTRRPYLRFVLPGRKVVRAEARANGKFVASRHGHHLRTITFRRPAPRVFSLRIVATARDGSKRTLTRRYTNCPK
jgi:Tol biopolymer transport system component